MTRKSQGVLVVACVVVGISLVLGSAVIWGPRHDCALQFPNIIGCAFGSYENLSGGLIAASGALFAAWLAWSAVTDQSRLEKQRILELKVEDLQRRAADFSRELSCLRSAYASGQWLLRLLREERRDPSPNASKLVELWDRKAFPTTASDWVSQTIGSRLWEAALRIRDIAKDLHQKLDNATADTHPGLLARYEPNAMEAVEFYDSILRELPGMMARTEEAVADENKRVGLARSDLDRLRG